MTQTLNFIGSFLRTRIANLNYMSEKSTRDRTAPN